MGTPRIYPRGSPFLRIALSCLLLSSILPSPQAVCEEEKLADLDRPRNIVLISIDTVRADHLDLHGYDRKTSPAVTAMASQGVVFQHAISQAPWTLPSMASVLTSLYPSEHGAVGARTRINQDIETLAEKLRSSGYHTIGIVSHTFVDKKHGFAQGFDIFDESQILGHNAITSEALTQLAIKYLKAEEDKPFFLWVHYFDPHFTYVRHPEFGFASGYSGELPDQIPGMGLGERRLSREDIEFVRSVYDEEIAYTDAHIGRLLSRIKRMGLDDSTVIILTADHGEYFMDRGKLFHGKDVYEPLVHVPLVISGAIPDKLRGREVGQSVGISSIPKTIMELVGIDNHSFHGENLLALADNNRDSSPVFTEGSTAWSERHRKKAIIYKGWKLIYNIDRDTYELYHIDADRKERKNLWKDSSTRNSELAIFMKQELDKFPSKEATVVEDVEMSDEVIKHLRSLGYVK